MNYRKLVIDKILSRSSLVGIFGLGYVGLPLATLFGKKSFRVLGFETDDQKIKAIRKGYSYLHQIDNSLIGELVSKNKLDVTGEFNLVSTLDVLIFCLPTPLGEHREPDLSFILNTLKNILPFLKLIVGRTIINILYIFILKII